MAQLARKLLWFGLVSSPTGSSVWLPSKNVTPPSRSHRTVIKTLPSTRKDLWLFSNKQDKNGPDEVTEGGIGGGGMSGRGGGGALAFFGARSHHSRGRLRLKFLTCCL